TLADERSESFDPRHAFAGMKSLRIRCVVVAANAWSVDEFQQLAVVGGRKRCLQAQLDAGVTRGSCHASQQRNDGLIRCSIIHVRTILLKHDDQNDLRPEGGRCTNTISDGLLRGIRLEDVFARLPDAGDGGAPKCRAHSPAVAGLRPAYPPRYPCPSRSSAIARRPAPESSRPDQRHSAPA